MTECTKTTRETQLRFDFSLGKSVVGAFDGGQISSDGGLVLIRQADERLKLTEQASLCIGEKRRPDLVKHKICDQFRQRLYGMTVGSEDTNDASTLRFDPMHKLCVGYLPSEADLASQPTLSRFENSITPEENDFLNELLVHLYVQKKRKPPRKIVLDLDTTCDPVHGYQQLSFFNGFYGTYCYIPMFVFDEDGFPLAAILRPGNADVGGDAARVLRRILKVLRSQWPKAAIEFRADAAFCRREVYQVCEENDVTYFIGLKSNHALRCLAKDLIESTKREFEEIYGTPSLKQGTAWRQKEERMRFATKQEGRTQEVFESTRMVRKVGQLAWRGRGYTDDMRVICRADYTDEGSDLRFVITNHPTGNPRWLYENRYCGRGQCENWIKELKSISCDRLSCEEFNANQFRLLEHVLAYVLMREVRERLAKRFGSISIEQLCLKFLKVGVRVKESVRRVCLHWTESYPRKQEFFELSTCLDL